MLTLLDAVASVAVVYLAIRVLTVWQRTTRNSRLRDPRALRRELWFNRAFIALVALFVFGAIWL